MLVNDLLSAMMQSVYYSKQPATPELLKQYGLELKNAGDKTTNIASVKIYSQNVLLNEINLGLRSENGLYTYAHIPGSNEIWLISRQLYITTVPLLLVSAAIVLLPRISRKKPLPL